MLPDRVSNPGPLTYESGALPIALHGLAGKQKSAVKFVGNVFIQCVKENTCICHLLKSFQG